MENPVIRDRERQEEWQDAENAKLENLIDNLSEEDEEKLKDAHADQYIGLDDDMPEDYENWFMGLNRLEIENILKDEN
jgi:hypothetical protein